MSQQPPNLLNPRYKSWDDLLLASVDHVITELALPDTGLTTRTWGERNTVRLRHPLSPALPGFLGRFLDMAPVQLPGDSNMPRVQGVDFGASERIVVEPGHEADGIFEMPTGPERLALIAVLPEHGEPAWETGRKPRPSCLRRRPAYRFVPVQGIARVSAGEGAGVALLGGWCTAALLDPFDERGPDHRAAVFA